MRVDPIDASDALIYRDGVLDYDAHDALLRSRGYDYLDLPCDCGGSEDDGHLPTCGWGRCILPVEVSENGSNLEA